MTRALKNYETCRKYLNKRVLIKTIDGEYRGKIIKVDKRKVYLRLHTNHHPGKANISFFPVIILPLVLFDLLAIVLLERPFFKPYRPYPPYPPHHGPPYKPYY